MTSKVGVIVGALALVAGVGLCGTSVAQTSRARTWCNSSVADGVSLDLQISGCTTLITSGKETTKNLAIDFNNRGLAFSDKGQSDVAIQDFDQAINLNPKYANAFN